MAIHVHGAGAALRDPATELGAGQPDLSRSAHRSGMSGLTLSWCVFPFTSSARVITFGAPARGVVSGRAFRMRGLGSDVETRKRLPGGPGRMVR